MLFRRDMEPNCAYCQYAERVGSAAESAEPDKDTAESAERVGETENAARDGTELHCVKRGTIPPEQSCKAFRYDPLKRVPPRPASLRRKFREEDFSL